MLPALNQVLPQDILLYALVFARVGAMVMTLPALGEAMIPPRVRLMLALALVILLEPVVAGTDLIGAAATLRRMLQPVVEGLRTDLAAAMAGGSGSRSSNHPDFKKI